MSEEEMASREQPEAPELPDLMEMELDDLAKLANEGAQASEEPEAAPEPVEVPMVEEETPPAVEASDGEEETAEDTEESAPEAEPTEDQIRAMEQQVKFEELQSKLDMQMAHNARLSGRIGELERNINSEPSYPTVATDYPEDAVDDGQHALSAQIADLRRQLEGLQANQGAESVSTAIAEEANVVTQRPEFQELGKTNEERAAAFKQAATKHQRDWQMVLETRDPNLARVSAKAVLGAILTEARRVEFESRMKVFEKRKADSASALKAQKRAEAASGTGSSRAVPPPRTKPVDLMTMPMKDLKKLAERTNR